MNPVFPLAARAERARYAYLVFTKSVNRNFNFARFYYLPYLEISLVIHGFATGAKMVSRFKTFSEDEI